MQPTTFHNLSTLRALLERAARWDIEAHEPSDSLAALAFEFRDCRLELIRRDETTLTQEQVHRLLQMDHRFDMVCTCHAGPNSVAIEAKRTLAAFGWLTDT